MSTIVWSTPVTQSFVAGSAKNTFDALASILGSDSNWAVNASDTTAAWIELKPRGGDYTTDRVLLVGGYAVPASMLLHGAIGGSDILCALCAMGDGGTGPDVANIATATGPYAGATTKYVAGSLFSAGADSITVSTCADGLVIALTETSTGDTWFVVAGRLFQTPAGADLPMVASAGIATNGANGGWWSYSSTAATFLFTTDNALTTSDFARTGITDGVTSGINLTRATGIAGTHDVSALDGGVGFAPMLMCYASSMRLAGVVRQMKMGGRRVAGTATIEVGGVVKAHGIGMNGSAAEDTLWLTQVP